MNIKTGFAAGLLALAICVPVYAQQAPTLYKRLGGYDALAAVTDDFEMEQFLFGSWYVCWGTKSAGAQMDALPYATERLIAAE